MKKIKFLRNVGPYKAGDIVELPVAQADALCQLSSINNGRGVETYQKAISLEDLEKIQSSPVAIEALTAKEAAELGVKNIVSPPSTEVPVKVTEVPVNEEAAEVEEPKAKKKK